VAYDLKFCQMTLHFIVMATLMTMTTSQQHNDVNNSHDHHCCAFSATMSTADIWHYNDGDSYDNNNGGYNNSDDHQPAAQRR